jgi:hypothetical protein
MRVAILTVIGLAMTTALTCAASPQAEGYRKLAAREIPAAFVGKTFTDGTHFSFRYRAGGVIDGTSMGKKVRNKWTVRNGSLCVTDSLGETCYVVWIKGKAVRLAFGAADLSVDGDLQ